MTVIKLHSNVLLEDQIKNKWIGAAADEYKVT